MDYKPEGSEWFTENDLPPPTSEQHGLDSEIREKLRPMKVTNWRMEGPGNLIGDTEHGQLVQRIPTDMICLGTSEDGLPILKKII